MPRVSEVSIWTVLLAVSLDYVGFSMLLPLLPEYALTLGCDAFGMGLIAASFSGAQMLGNIVLGSCSDCYGRKVVLCGSLAATALALAAHCRATSLWLLIAVRGTGGFFAGTLGLSQAYIVEVCFPSELGQYQGLLGAAMSAGVALGPAISAVLVPFGFQVVSLTAAGAAVVNLLFCIYFMIDPPRDASSSREQRRGVRPTSALPPAEASLKQKVSSPIIFLFCLTALHNCGIAALQSMIALYNIKHFNFTDVDQALFFTLFGTVAVISQFCFTQRALVSMGTRGTTIAGHLVRIAAFAILIVPPIGDKTPHMFAILFALSMLVQPAVISMIGEQTPEGREGLIMGTNQMIAAGARCLAPIAAGAMYTWQDYSPWVALIAVSATCVLLASVLVRGRAPLQPLPEEAEEQCPLLPMACEALESSAVDGKRKEPSKEP